MTKSRSHRTFACMGVALAPTVLGCAALLAPRPVAAQAEHYGFVEVGTGISFDGAPSTSSYGIGASAELRLNVTDEIAAGARLEGFVMAGGSIDGVDSVSMNLRAGGAILAKGEYRFLRGAVRPFIGLGLGMFSLGGESVAAGAGGASVAQEAGRFFGLVPEVGIQLGFVRLSFAYHLIFGAGIEVTQTVGTMPSVEHISRNYFSLELAIRFGGGEREAPPSAPAASPTYAPSNPSAYPPSDPSAYPSAPPPPSYAPTQPTEVPILETPTVAPAVTPTPSAAPH